MFLATSPAITVGILTHTAESLDESATALARCAWSLAVPPPTHPLSVNYIMKQLLFHKFK